MITIEGVRSRPLEGACLNCVTWTVGLDVSQSVHARRQSQAPTLTQQMRRRCFGHGPLRWWPSRLRAVAPREMEGAVRNQCDACEPSSNLTSRQQPALPPSKSRQRIALSCCTLIPPAFLPHHSPPPIPPHLAPTTWFAVNTVRLSISRRVHAQLHAPLSPRQLPGAQTQSRI